MLCPREPAFFAGNLWEGSTIADTNCFFGACGITGNAGTAGEKTEEEFKNGTVAGLLGDAFAQARNYPRFKDNPADYSAVDAAIAKANALEKDNYKDFSAVEAAINTVVRDKNITEQGEVDAMAQAIENAITRIEQNIRRNHDGEVDSEVIGNLVMKELADLDEITYVRFASVYRSFKDVDEIEELLQEITKTVRAKKESKK